jgi:predicted phosphodiesterase
LALECALEPFWPVYGLISDLLKQVSYDKEKDALIHLGDITAKGPLAGSFSVLSFLNKYNITGVRGNHDQKVIEWRAWLDWINGLEAGANSHFENEWEGNVSGELDDNSEMEVVR